MSFAIADSLRDIAPEPDRELAELWRYAPTARLARWDFAPAAAQAGTIVVPAGTVETRELDEAGLSDLTIIIGAGATLTLLERVQGSGLHKLRVSGTVGAGATLNHLRLAGLGDEDYHFTRSMISVAAGGQYRYFAAVKTGAQSRHQIEVALNGPGARCDLAGLYALAGQQLADHTLIVKHNAPLTNSSQFFRGVAADQARGAFQGKIIVAKGADGTDAQQSHKALLLGERAEIDAKPELEIHADAVKCSHGASVGKLDADALFYLRARGLSEAEARQLLTAAFLQEAVTRADWLPEDWRTQVEASLAAD